VAPLPKTPGSNKPGQLVQPAEFVAARTGKFPGQ